MNFLQVAGVSKREGKGFELQQISFNQPQFRQIAIAGETGSGKSTLLKLIAGWISPDAGEVRFEDVRILKIPEEKLIPGHPGISYLSQHFELPNFLTVEQVLSYANVLTDEEAATIYEVCHISHLLGRRTDQLSGGEKQRIALARLLITSPKLLLLDEPFSNLDMIHKNILKAVIRDLGSRLGITGILVSHDPQDTLSWADEIIVLKEGQIVQQGPPAQIYGQPVNEYVAGLFGKYNLVPAAKAAAFAALPGIHPGGKRLLIRPEHFSITAANEGLAGHVQQLLFFGSYYEMEVLLNGQLLTVRTKAPKAAPGDTIYLSLSPDQVWYL
jgi:ABC-type Fe3+/spermidine/putrescine transport system ATPase subunit